MTDDNALKLFLKVDKELFANAPLFFSGINDLTLSSSLDPNKYSGVFETKDIAPNIELIRQFSPQTRDIWFIGDASTTYSAVEAEIKKEIDHYPNLIFHFIASENIDDIVKKLPNTPKSFVLLTTVGAFKDNHGTNISVRETIDMLRQNKNLILCSMEDSYMLEGVVGGFVTSGTKQGLNAAVLTSRYLNSEPMNMIASLTKSPNVYMFNRTSLTQSRLILSEYIARNSIILHERKTFVDRYQEMILNLAFIIFILFLVTLVVLFVVFVQKKLQVSKLKKSYEECRTELQEMKNKIALMEHDE